jgi:hypothetical protein
MDLPESANINNHFFDLPNNLHVDAEVQTKSLWKLFKKSLKKFFFCEPSQDISASDSIAESNVQDISAPDHIAESNVQDISAPIYESVESNVQDNASSIYESVESLQEIAQIYDIMDSLSFAEAVNQAPLTYVFENFVVSGIDYYNLIIPNAILSINPDLITPFI